MNNLFYGLMYGQAIGDAVGYYTEFYYESQLRTLYPTKDSFTFPASHVSFMRMKRTSECDWTDDTDQMILLMEMLTETGNRISLPLFVSKLSNWVKYGFKELGDTRGEGCGNLLDSVVNQDCFLTDPMEASRVAWKGHNAPNGSIMRTAIMAFRNLDYETSIRDAVQMSVCTHYDSRCSVATAVLTSILWHLIYDKEKPESYVLNMVDQICEMYTLASAKHSTGGALTEGSCEEAKEWCRKQTLDEMKLNEQIGYSLKCMGVAVWAYKNRTRPYKEVILEIVLKGGDADTNAAVAGSILGTFHGFQKLPQEWLTKLPNKEWLDKKCKLFIETIDQLGQRSSSVRPSDDQSSRPTNELIGFCSE